MLEFLAFTAAFFTAILNGLAAVFEKLGAEAETIARTAHPNLLWKLRHNSLYILGIVLDILAALLTLFAVHRLPLFIVQPIIACSVIVTVIIERYRYAHKLKPAFLIYILVIVVGLILLALSSGSNSVAKVSLNTRLLISLFPLVLLILGSIFVVIQKKYATYALASISGLSFGGISISGRAEIFHKPYFHLFLHPLTWAILAYGLIGILFFTIALQRASATAVNATMIASETLLPIVVGLSILGDHPKNSMWLIVYLGVLFTLTGTLLTALKADKLYAN